MSETRILFGFHAVLSRMRQHGSSIQEIIIDQDRVDARMRDLLDMAKSQNIRSSPSETAWMGLSVRMAAIRA
jgi:23S rRNA (guanosine2251-2'-O)-methyltransferase